MSNVQLTGEVLNGRYRLGGRLGGGNFGTVYRAEELLDGVAVREVALKLYSPEATKSGDVEGMFQDCSLPAKILSSAISDDIKRHFVQIFAWGTLPTPIGECAYVSMELVKSAVTLEDLTERYARSGGHPDESDVLDKMKQFFAALAVAHGAGVVHRDIKGANVMISANTVKIVDFGMGASMSDDGAALKTTTSIYAPENFSGKYTAASDIYQAGLMFYKYWTGAQPFEREIPQWEAETPEEYARRMMEEAHRMRVDWHYVPGSEMIGMTKSEKLDSVLSRCLRFSDTQRYNSALHILPSLEKDDLATAQSAFSMGNLEYANDIARRILERGGATEGERVELLRLCGDVAKASGDARGARDHYLEAYKLADQTGVYFLAKPRMRELLLVLVECYEALGQSGMAKLYKKKIM